ncbi:hypothetical protein ACFLYB_03495 [Chloroflexota bacterium]
MGDPFRQAEPVQESTNKYEILGLRENPFPAEPSLKPGSGDPRENGTIYNEELHRDKQDILEKLMIPSPEQRNPLSIAFLMDHATRRGRGIGKSAFLKYQRDRIMSDFGESSSKGSAVICAIHVIPPPGCRKFWEFCRLIMETLIEQDVLGTAIWRLRAFSGIIPDVVLKEIHGVENLAETLGNDKWLEGKNIQVTFGLNRAVLDALQTAGVTEDLARILAYTPTSRDLRTRVLSQFSNYHWQKNGGRLVFDDLVKVFVAAKFTRGLFFIDELEKIVYHQNMMERRAFVESLRYFLLDADFANSKTSFLGILLTIHPGIQELLSPHWKAAGLDGISPITQPEAQETTIYFGPLSQSMAIPLVKSYLDYFRIPEAKKDGIEPFTKEAVAEALVKSGGVPRPMLRLLHRVIENAVKSGKPIIDKDLIEQVYAIPEHFEAEELSEEEAPPPTSVDLQKE